MSTLAMEQLSHIHYAQQQHTRFREAELLEAWAHAYPFLFDALDIANARSQAKHGYHFVEWLSAIHLFHTHGLFSLQSKYLYKKHVAKGDVVDQLASPEVLAFLRTLTSTEYFQSPDLLSYRPDLSEWFFVEVKGPKDRMRDSQVEFFERLQEGCGVPIKLVSLSMIPSPS